MTFPCSLAISVSLTLKQLIPVVAYITLRTIGRHPGWMRTITLWRGDVVMMIKRQRSACSVARHWPTLPLPASTGGTARSLSGLTTIVIARIPSALTSSVMTAKGWPAR